MFWEKKFCFWKDRKTYMRFFQRFGLLPISHQDRHTCNMRCWVLKLTLLSQTGEPEHKLSAPRWKEDRRSWPPSPLEARRSLFHSPWRIFPVEECENFFSILGWDWFAAKRQTNLSIVFQKICSNHQRQGEKCPLLHTVLCHKRGSRVPIIECTTLVISLIYLTVSQPNKWVNN